MTEIRNIVFDVGDVLVRWSPQAIIQQAIPEEPDPATVGAALFGHPIWRELNRGETTEQQTQAKFCAELGFSPEVMERIFHSIKDTQSPIPGMFEMLKRVRSAGYLVYALTDNVNEIITYLKQRYDFWDDFHGAIVSSEVGLTKPDLAIYQRLLSDYNLIADQTIFTDDRRHNIDGANAAGIHGFVFTDAAQCEAEFAARGIQI